MIDLHSHVLPGVDDGAANLEESRAMLMMAAESGTRVLVATPHADLRFTFDPVLCRTLITELAAIAPAGLRLCLGCELHLTPENIECVLDTPALYALNGGDCILLELPLDLVPPMVQPAVEALVNRGLRVLVAHPERNPFVQQHPDFAASLVDSGCWLQLTAGSLTRSFGMAAESAAEWLLHKRLAHCVASDAHGAKRRRPVLALAFEKVARRYGSVAAEVLFRANPDAILRGGTIRSMPLRQTWISSLFARSLHANGTHPANAQMS
jgi:protein-tyrosine phosphatase